MFLDAARELTYAELLRAYLGVLPAGLTAVDGVSALRLWGVEVGSALPFRFVTTADHHSIRARVRVRRTVELPSCTRSVLDPVPALVAARADLGLVELVTAGDWLVREGRATQPEVSAGLAAATGRHCRLAKRAAGLVRAGSESPQESRLRLLLVLAGLPEPEPNVELHHGGRFLARVDLYLRAWRIAAEYEGDHHRTDPATFAKDLGRYERLVSAGVVPVRVAKVHLQDPRAVVRRIHVALVARGYDGPAPVFGAEWRAAFESGAPAGDVRLLPRS